MNVPRSRSDYGPPRFTSIPVTKVRAFTVRNYHELTFRFEWHYHPEWEITFTRNGKGTRHIGSSLEKFDSGDLVLLPGNVPHSWLSGPDQVGDTLCSVIHFLPQAWGERFWQLPEMSKFNALCQRSQRGLRFTGPEIEEIGTRMEILAANNQASLECMSELLSIFSLICRLTVHPLHGSKGSGSTWQNPRLDVLLDWLEDHLTEPITQREAAERAKMSPAAFSRWFKSNMGCVFQRYLNEMRVARVCSQLATADGSITEIAFQAGYNNLSNFNRRFQEVIGLTPKAYRSQVREKITPGLAS